MTRKRTKWVLNPDDPHPSEEDLRLWAGRDKGYQAPNMNKTIGSQAYSAPRWVDWMGDYLDDDLEMMTT